MFRGETRREVLLIRRIATSIAIAAVFFGVAATNAEAVQRIPPKCRSANAHRLCAIHVHFHAVNNYRARMGQRSLRYGWMAERTHNPVRRERILSYWTQAHKAAKSRYGRWVASPMSWYYSSGAQCVHNREGTWHDNTGNGYYGGFQYDVGTWDSAGGTRYASRADLASPLAQIIVTMHKVRSDGWGAWPNTARACGLL